MARTITLVFTFVLVACAAGCAHKQRTPFDHLYGEAWCDGVYREYAERFENVYQGAGGSARDSYTYLVQDGGAALTRLQSRGTPFFVGIDPASGRFSIRREIPERLMFTVEMTAEDRQRATAEFEAARVHLADDYTDVQRLENTFNGLLDTLTGIRGVIQQTEEESYNLSHIRVSMREGNLPFEMPYQVTPKRYDDVLVLVLARLEKDLADLRSLEAGIMTVVLAARATDSRSQSSAGNIEVAVLASLEDFQRGAANRLPPAMPGGDVWTVQRGVGEAAYSRIVASPGYQQFATAKGASGPDPIGAVLSVIDAAYGTHLADAAQAVRQMVEGGEADYFALLKSIASLAPAGSVVGTVLDKAVLLTDTYRQAVATVDKAKALAGKIQNAGEALAEIDGVSPEWLINEAGSVDGAMDQIVFIKSEAEQLDVRNKLAEFGLF